MEQSKVTGRRMGCFFGVLTGIAIVVFLVFLFFFGFPHSSRNLSKYETLLTKYTNLRTVFVVFPPSIPDSALENEPEFYFFYQDTLFAPTAEVYLRCTYDETDYNAEIDRLEHYQHTLKGLEVEEKPAAQTFMKDEEGRFSYSAYIAILADNDAYEYALITGEREITYVYFVFKEPGNFREVPADCLPEPFVSELSPDTGGYNIYRFRLVDSKPYSYYVVYQRDGAD